MIRKDKNSVLSLMGRGSLDPVHAAAAFKIAELHRRIESSDLKTNLRTRDAVDCSAGPNIARFIDARSSALQKLKSLERDITGVWGRTGWKIIVHVAIDNESVRSFNKGRGKSADRDNTFICGLLREALETCASLLGLGERELDEAA